MSKENRKEINLDQAANVNGGMLSVNIIDGTAVLQVRDDNYQVFKQYTILKSGREVSQLLQTKYWDMDEGHRDEQMIAYLEENGYI